MMLRVVLVELVLLAALWLAFAVQQVRRGLGNWPARLLLATAVFGLVESLALVALGTRHTLPMWVYVGVFGALDAVAAGWLWLQWRAGREEARDGRV